MGNSKAPKRDPGEPPRDPKEPKGWRGMSPGDLWSFWIGGLLLLAVGTKLLWALISAVI